MNVFVDLEKNAYDIIIERGALKKAGEYLNLKRKVFIVTDGGVPEAYVKQVASCCDKAVTVTVHEGESSKSITVWENLLERMLAEHFTRSDAVVAVGGGVVGDLAGFTASAFMRGIDFYNIPTTLLSQVDSSVGGKTAVNLGGDSDSIGAVYGQLAGAFYGFDAIPDRWVKAVKTWEKVDALIESFLNALEK